MHPAVLAHLSASGGLITRTDALDLGVSPLYIASLLRGGSWVLVRRGVYADGELWATLDEYREKPLLRARAAVLVMKRGWRLSHDSSAHAQGLDIVRPDDPFVHITRPGFTNAWTKSGVKHHLARFAPEQVVEVDGVPALDLARTAVDIARERKELHGVPACDSARRMGVTLHALWTAAAIMVSWSNVTCVRNSIELSDPGAQNVAESLGRMLVRELGAGEPETQFPVLLSKGRVAWGDIRVGNHIFEIDGRIKLRGIDEGGVAVGRLEEVLWEEKKRERLLAQEGLGTSRIFWEDLWGEKRKLAKLRLRAEYDHTVQRFGTKLPEHLARNALEIRSRRGA